MDWKYEIMTTGLGDCLNLVVFLIIWGCSSVGRALALQARGIAGSNPASSTIWPIRLDGLGHEAFNFVTVGSSPLSVTAE